MSQNTFESTTGIINPEPPNYEPIQTEPSDLSSYCFNIIQNEPEPHAESNILEMNIKDCDVFEKVCDFELNKRISKTLWNIKLTSMDKVKLNDKSGRVYLIVVDDIIKKIGQTDDNFGIIKHDVEIAKYLRRTFDTHKYPVALKIYSAKKQNDRVREVGLILKPLMTYVVSFQTTTPEVQKKTKRVSATHDEATESIAFARKNGMSTATELIFGLPGETLSSWKNVINKTINYGFDSLGMIPLWLLKGSDLNTDSARDENKYVGKFMVGENAVTEVDDFVSVERDEIAVQSKYYTYEEWKTVMKYQINLLLANFYGYAKELLYYANSINIKPTDLFDHMISDNKKYPVMYELVQSYVKSYEDNMFDTEEDLYGFINKNLEKFKNDREFLIRLGQKRGLLGYVVKYILNDHSQGLCSLNAKKYFAFACANMGRNFE